MEADDESDVQTIDGQIELQRLEHDRFLNDQRLKSRFEQIFAKYSYDFEGIGDEIDIRTGEIVVNNGHLEHMRDEVDTSNSTSAGIVTSFLDHGDAEEIANDDDQDDQAGDEADDDSLDELYDETEDDEDEQDLPANRHQATDTDLKREPPDASQLNSRAFHYSVNRPAPRLAHLLLGQGTLAEPFDLTEGGRTQQPAAIEIPSDDDEVADVKPVFDLSNHMPVLEQSLEAFRSLSGTSGLDERTMRDLSKSIAKHLAVIMRNDALDRKPVMEPKNRPKEQAWDYPEPGDTAQQIKYYKEVRAPPPATDRLQTLKSPSRRSLWRPARKRRRIEHANAEAQEGAGRFSADPSAPPHCDDHDEEQSQAEAADEHPLSHIKLEDHEDELSAGVSEFPVPEYTLAQTQHRFNPQPTFSTTYPQSVDLWNTSHNGQTPEADASSDYSTYSANTSRIVSHHANQHVRIVGSQVQPIALQHQLQPLRPAQANSSIHVRSDNVTAMPQRIYRPLAAKGTGLDAANPIDVEDTQPWKQDEDDAILQMKEMQNKSWDQIAEKLAGRTARAVYLRYGRILRPDPALVLHQGPTSGALGLQLTKPRKGRLAPVQPRDLIARPRPLISAPEPVEVKPTVAEMQAKVVPSKIVNHRRYSPWENSIIMEMRAEGRPWSEILTKLDNRERSSLTSHFSTRLQHLMPKDALAGHRKSTAPKKRKRGEKPSLEMQHDTDVDTVMLDNPVVPAIDPNLDGHSQFRSPDRINGPEEQLQLDLLGAVDDSTPRSLAGALDGTFEPDSHAMRASATFTLDIPITDITQRKPKVKHTKIELSSQQKDSSQPELKAKLENARAGRKTIRSSPHREADPLEPAIASAANAGFDNTRSRSALSSAKRKLREVVEEIRDDSDESDEEADTSLDAPSDTSDSYSTDHEIPDSDDDELEIVRTSLKSEVKQLLRPAMPGQNSSPMPRSSPLVALADVSTAEPKDNSVINGTQQRFHGVKSPPYIAHRQPISQVTAASTPHSHPLQSSPSLTAELHRTPLSSRKSTKPIAKGTVSKTKDPVLSKAALATSVLGRISTVSQKQAATPRLAGSTPSSARGSLKIARASISSARRVIETPAPGSDRDTSEDELA